MPTSRIAFLKQLDILRAYSAASEEGARGVPNEAVARIIGLSASTVSLANPFFADNGLIERREGGHVPAPEVVAFARAYQWDADYAASELAPLLSLSWFGQILTPRLKFSSLSEENALRELGTAANAGPKYRAQLKTLVDYLEAANLVVRNGNMLEPGEQLAEASSRKEDAPRSSEGDQEPDKAPAPTPGRSLPLLIQGLLQELPRGSSWSREAAERWLNLAKLTFEMVYDFEDPPGSTTQARPDNGSREE